MKKIEKLKCSKAKLLKALSKVNLPKNRNILLIKLSKIERQIEHTNINVYINYEGNSVTSHTYVNNMYTINHTFTI